MYIVIKKNPDGDSYKISTDLDKSKKTFMEETKECSYPGEFVYLIKIEKDLEFGFGAYGDIFGGEVIIEFEFEENEEEL
jgi:hypothetical protein